MLRVDLQKKRLIIQENFKHYFSLIASHTITNPSITYMTTNIKFPILNAVLEATLQEDNLEKMMQEVHQFYQSQNCPYSWWLTSLSQPINLKTVLENNNFKAFLEFKGMLYDLEEKPISNSGILPELEIIPVHNIYELNQWMQPITVAFQFTESVSQGYLQAIKNAFVNCKDKLQHFFGVYQGKHVASASIFWDKHSAGLYNLGVLPEFRQLGIATELKKFRLELSKKKNYRYVSLQSSALGFPLDKKLGFEEYLTYSNYTKN